MYGWIWRSLPGGRVGKIVGSLVLILAVSAALLFVVFPWIAPLLPWNDLTVQ
ncbi:MAG: hypothetical protein H0T54_09305 [Geodermatophilaceae bacterium]|nr:hypothetical protein [Geodermatophilaceae bacterium]